MKIAICDDNQISVNYIEEYISRLSLKNISYEVFTSGNELIKFIENNPSDELFNIYFMDIEMPGLNGIETATYIRKIDDKALIIFITEHQNYVFNVFEVLPFRFIVKPLTEDRLKTVLHEAIENIQTMKQIFFFKVERLSHHISYDKILYFEGNGRKVRLITESNEYEFYDKISNIYNNIDQNIFMQIHTSYLVNMEFIRSINETEIIMEGNRILPISKKFRKDVKLQHLNFMEWRCGR